MGVLKNVGLTPADFAGIVLNMVLSWAASQIGEHADELFDLRKRVARMFAEDEGVTPEDEAALEALLAKLRMQLHSDGSVTPVEDEPREDGNG